MVNVRRSLVSFLRIPGVRQCASALLTAIAFLTVGGDSRKKFTVMQVGGRGGADPYTKWLRARGAVHTIGVEPESSGLEKLRAHKAYDHIVTKALSDTAGTAPLYITKAKGWCSLLKPDEAAIKKIATEECLRIRPFEVTGTENVELTTLDAIHSSLPHIDFLQIDVQGAELKVLKGATESLKTIGMIELETRFYPIYEHEHLFPETSAFLQQQGFALFLMSQQGQHEFGENFVEVNACFYNSRIAQKYPELMTTLQNYAKAKHEHYTNKILRLLGDI